MSDIEIQIVRNPITRNDLTPLRVWHVELIKGVADLEQKIIALGGEWHMDANNVLIADGSEQKNLWGFNIYPDEKGDAAIAYESLINIRPAQGNKSMILEDQALCMQIRSIVKKLVPNLGL